MREEKNQQSTAGGAGIKARIKQSNGREVRTTRIPPHQPAPRDSYQRQKDTKTDKTKDQEKLSQESSSFFIENRKAATHGREVTCSKVRKISHLVFIMRRSMDAALESQAEPSATLSFWRFILGGISKSPSMDVLTFKTRTASKDSLSASSGSGFSTAMPYIAAHSLPRKAPSTSSATQSRYRYKLGWSRRGSPRSEQQEDAGDLTMKSGNSKACTLMPCLVVATELFCSNDKKNQTASQMSLTGCSDILAEDEKSQFSTGDDKDNYAGICDECFSSDCPFLSNVLDALTEEVQQRSPISLLRGDSEGLRMVSRYSRKHAARYTSWLLDDSVQDVLTCAEQMDQEGYFVPGGMTNTWKLLYLSEQALPHALNILHNFQTSQHRVPPVIRTICKHFFEEFCCKYPTFSRRESLVFTVGRFLMLKLVCPLIVRSSNRTSKLGKQMLTFTARLVLTIGLGNTSNESLNPPSLKKKVLEEESARTVAFWQSLLNETSHCDEEDVISFVPGAI